jgi:type IV pilus assembly protein PilE
MGRKEAEGGGSGRMLHPRPRGQAGVTLVELLVTLAVLAVLAAIAVGGYRQYSIRTSRTEAREALLEDAQFMERNYATVNLYNNVTASDLPVTQTPRDGGAAKYSIAFKSGGLTAQDYTLQAAPTGSMTGDACGTYTLKQDGTQGITGGSLTAQECWAK